jgi:hypothetical protein
MGLLNIVDLMYNASIAYVSIFNNGGFNNPVWVSQKFVLVYGFIL